LGRPHDQAQARRKENTKVSGECNGNRELERPKEGKYLIGQQ